jgi:peptidoglycan/xylan/chitin deacetylase (PgdA/CDA1 family)
MQQKRHLRTRLISVLDGIGVLEAAMIVRKHVRLPYLPIVTYHRLGDPKRDAADLDDTVVDATKESFEKQVALFNKHFTLLGIEELRQFFLEGRPLPKNSAVITFDDGYKACYDIALPILKRANAKAIFFISTDHMTHRKAFWWDRTNYLIKRSKKTRIELDYPTRAVYELTGDRTKVVQQILDVIKQTFGMDVERYLQEISKAAGVPWGPEDDKRITDEILMTWDQVRELHKAGMDIESHSKTHRVLTTLPPDELKEELEGSKRVLEEKLDTTVRSIAYPVSLSLADHDDILVAVQKAGYDIGFSTSSGLGPLGPKTNPLDIQRFWVDPTLPHSYFRCALAVPHLTYRRR